MAKTDFSQWDTTAANNTDVNSITLGENQLIPSNINNAFREIMAQLATALQGGATVTFISTDAGATVGPVVNLFRNSASPLDDDLLGKTSYTGKDSAGNTHEYAAAYAAIVSPVNNSESGRYVIQVSNGSPGLVDSVNLRGATEMGLGPSGTSAYTLLRSDASGSLRLIGGPSSGGRIQLFGSGHATEAYDILFAGTGGTQVYRYDDSATSHTFTGKLAGGGTTTNDSASAGQIGEYVESTILAGGAVSLTNNTAADITSISLTAGDWDVSGNVAFLADTTTTVTRTIAYITTASATLPTSPNSGALTQRFGSAQTNEDDTQSAGHRRISIASTTTVYLGAFANFATSTMTAFGHIHARRMR